MFLPRPFSMRQREGLQGAGLTTFRLGSLGFTLIELMVVIAIIVMAAGLMTPTITDFFKNRQLESLRGHLGAAFNRARLAAVNQGKPVSMVFFREGVRIYDDTQKTFDEEDDFNPQTAPFASDKVWCVLGFFGKKTNLDLPAYSQWEENQRSARGELESLDGDAAAAAKSPGKAARGPVYNVSGLPRITFQRDGSLVFTGGGGDVTSTIFNAKDIPDNADVIVNQLGNTTVLFVDFKPAGQIKYKIMPVREAPTKPTALGGADDNDFEIDYETLKPTKSTVNTEEEVGGDE